MVIDAIIITLLMILFYVYWLNPRIIHWILTNKKNKGLITEKDIQKYYEKHGWFRK